MSPDVERAMRGLREWMFEHVYRNPAAKGEEGRAQQLIVTLYEYYMKHVDELPEEYLDDDGDTRGEERAGGLRLYCRDERWICHRPV